MRVAVLLALMALPLLQAERQPLTFEMTWVNRRSTRPAGVQHRTLHSKAMQQ